MSGPMSRPIAAAGFLLFTAVAAGPAVARVSYPEGIACHGRYHSGPPLAGVAGFFMGARNVAPRQGNPRDTRSFQGCFRTVEACALWQARLASRYPLPPAITTCTSVRLR